MPEPAVLDPAVRAALDLARDVLAELDLELVLARLVTSARELSSAKYAALGVLDESRQELCGSSRPASMMRAVARLAHRLEERACSANSSATQGHSVSAT